MFKQRLTSKIGSLKYSLSHGAWQGIGAIVGIAALIVALLAWLMPSGLSIPFQRRITTPSVSVTPVPTSWSQSVQKTFTCKGCGKLPILITTTSLQAQPATNTIVVVIEWQNTTGQVQRTYHQAVPYGGIFLRDFTGTWQPNTAFSPSHVFSAYEKWITKISFFYHVHRGGYQLKLSLIVNKTPAVFDSLTFTL